MKKIMIFAALAALLSLSSCGKEEIKNAADASSNGSPVFTAGINPGTKTTVAAQDGTLAWENSDVITITDGGGDTATYHISGIDASTGKATFEYSSGAVLGVGPYTAVYGTQPEKNQTYSATAPGKLYMTASSENNVLTFTVQCALMEINLTKEGESVKKIEVTGKPEGKNETTYTLTCTEAVSIAEKKAFYIALPAGTYTKIVITDSEGKVCTLNVKTQGIPVTVNQIIPATFDAEHLIFPPKGALPGVFSVSATKKVHFSKGNLYYNGSKFDFEANQYEYHGYDSANNIWGLFGWVGASSTAFTSSPEIYGVSISGANSDYGNSDSDALKADWGTAIDDKGTWRTLTHEEWCYLFDNHVKVWGQCNSVNGYFIAPDGYEGDATALTSAVTDWASAEAAGIVFLPAAGYRYDSRVYDVGNGGIYWSSTASDSFIAYSVTLMSFFVELDFGNSRSNGISVRLITESK